MTHQKSPKSPRCPSKQSSYIHYSWCIYGFAISCLNVSRVSLFLLLDFYICKFTLHLPFSSKYVSDNVACLLKQKWKTQRTPITLGGARMTCRAPPARRPILISDLRSAWTQCPRYKGLSITPRYPSTLWLVGTPPLHGMSSPTHSTRFSSNVTSSVELSLLTVLSCTLPCSSQNKLLLPLYLHRKCWIKKKKIAKY